MERALFPNRPVKSGQPGTGRDEQGKFQLFQPPRRHVSADARGKVNPVRFLFFRKRQGGRMNEVAPAVKAGTYRNPETGAPRRGRLTGRWLPLSAGTAEGGREGGLAWTRRISPLHQGLFRMIGGEGLACHTGVAAFASASSSVLRPLTLTRCSRRMRRSSTAEAGSSCTLCPDGTIFHWRSSPGGMSGT